jgi:uncharacterized protein
MPEAVVPPAALTGLSLADIAARAADQRLPPVAQWDPPLCGDSGMRIAADGTWYHDGAPIRRPALVRLFAGLLRREGDGYVLVTPVEKLTIAVADRPFVAVEVKSEGLGRARRLAFRLNTDAVIVAGPAHPLAFAERPWLAVRDGLTATLARPVYYELAELALAEGDDPPGLWSEGAFFPLGAA